MNKVPTIKKISLLGAGAVAGVVISVGVTAVAQLTGRAPLNEVQQIFDVIGLVKTHYVEPVSEQKLIKDAVSGMLQGLDPHSSYLDKESYKEMLEGIKGEFAGLGLEVGTEDGFVKVISPIEDTPAARAGIRAGDLIVRIDDRETKGLALSEAVKLMRGPLNSQVTLTLSRKGEPLPITVRLTRAVIQVQSVRSKMHEPGIGYIRISSFNERTVPNFTNAIKNLHATSPLKSLIIDLRNDPGGVLEGALGVASTFLPDGVTITYTDGQISAAKRNYTSNPRYYLRPGESANSLPAIVKTIPLVVLVNQGSASASEIVAGALKDHKRATLIGQQTFGKGSVQSILPINESRTEAIKLTTSRYYTPNGVSIQAKGITPDYIVDETPDGDPLAELRQREANLARHLSNDKNAKPEAKPALTQEEIAQRAAAERAALEKLRNMKPLDPGSADDHQFQQALNFLKGQPVQTAKPKQPVAQTSSTR